MIASLPVEVQKDIGWPDSVVSRTTAGRRDLSHWVRHGPPPCRAALPMRRRRGSCPAAAACRICGICIASEGR